MVSSPTQMISVIQMAVLKAVLDKRYSRDITCCVHYPRKYFASSGSLQNNKESQDAMASVVNNLHWCNWKILKALKDDVSWVKIKWFNHNVGKRKVTGVKKGEYTILVFSPLKASKYYKSSAGTASPPSLSSQEASVLQYSRERLSISLQEQACYPT